MQVVPDVTEGIFDRTHIRPAYQPIVDLAHGDVVAVEALARWPELSVTPDAAFGYARRTGRVKELDSLCQRAAIEGLRGHGVPARFAVFVNVEPGNSVGVLTERSTGPTLVAEITERALLNNPAELLRTIREMRDQGCGIALDDVGAVPDSLALLPFVAPDIIKLDISLVQDRPTAEQARILTAVAAYAERSGATVLAEGIETHTHYDQALALGATLGQGWYFARPGPLTSYPTPCQPVERLPAPTTDCGTPYQLLDPRRIRVGTKRLLLSMSHHIEQQGQHLETAPLVLSAFQHCSHFTPDTVRRYKDLATRCPLVVALAEGLSSEPAPGVRGANLAPGDPLRGEWSVVIVGPHYRGALIAKDLGDTGLDLDRRFLFALTHDPETVLNAARSLLSRIGASDK